ncbi:MAG: FCD domain-containing protein, partial [Actinomycetota bacterium]
IPGRVEASVEEHAVIVEAIMGRRADEAERLMRGHIESVLGDQLAGTPPPATADEVGLTGAPHV